MYNIVYCNGLDLFCEALVTIWDRRIVSFTRAFCFRIGICAGDFPVYLLVVMMGTLKTSDRAMKSSLLPLAMLQLFVLWMVPLASHTTESRIFLNVFCEFSLVCLQSRSHWEGYALSPTSNLSALLVLVSILHRLICCYRSFKLITYFPVSDHFVLFAFSVIMHVFGSREICNRYPLLRYWVIVCNTRYFLWNFMWAMKMAS